MNTINGLNIVSTPMAVQRHTEFKVERVPIKKRRRQYRVRRHELVTPGCYRAGDTLYMPPTLIAKLNREIGP